MPEPVEIVVRNAKQELTNVTMRMLDGKVSTAYWQREVGLVMRRYWLQAYMGGLGREPTNAERRVLRQELNKQAYYLRRFRSDIETGLSSPLQTANRVLMYGDRLWGEWERGKADRQEVILPQYPGDGNTQCLTHCRCHLEYEDTPDGQVAVTWHVNRDEETCPDCLALGDEWNPLVVPHMVKKAVMEANNAVHGSEA